MGYLLSSLFLVPLLLLQNGPNIPNNPFTGTVAIIPINLKVAPINARIIIQTITNIVNKMRKTFLCYSQYIIVLPFIPCSAILCTCLLTAVRRFLFPHRELGKCYQFITVAVTAYQLLIYLCFCLPLYISFYLLVPLQF